MTGNSTRIVVNFKDDQPGLSLPNRGQYEVLDKLPADLLPYGTDDIAFSS